LIVFSPRGTQKPTEGVSSLKYYTPNSYIYFMVLPKSFLITSNSRNVCYLLLVHDFEPPYNIRLLRTD